jgi:hypothetical protein
MSEQWHYRISGQDFGPVGLDELKQLAESGKISRGDQVRPDSSSNWVAAETVSELASPSVEVPASSSAEVPTSPSPIVAASTDDSVADQLAPNDWYCRFDDQVLGPLSFQELVDFTKGGLLTAEIEVKWGAQGKWRRVDSIGPLLAVLPIGKVVLESHAEVSSHIPTPDLVPIVTAALASPVVAEDLKSPALDRDIVRAEAIAEATEYVVRQMIGFTLIPGCDPSWWVAINGAESGPIAFAQLFELALSGQLNPGDFIRNGIYGQYAHAANLPGLFVAVVLVKHSKDAVEQVKLQAAEAVKHSLAVNAPPEVIEPVTPVPIPPPAPLPSPAPPTRPKPAAETEVKRPIPELKSGPASPKTHPANNPAVSGGSYGSMASTSTPYRPPTPAPNTFKPKQKESSNSPLSMALDLLNTPAGKAVIAALVLVLVGWTFMANRNNGDIQRYKALKRILDDVRTKRFVKSTEVQEIKTRAKKVSEELIPQLKGSTSPVKKALLAAASDDLPKMMQQDLATESNDEKNFVKRLNEAKKILGLK